MLLFTKLATPKIPKRRSRAGCTSCKEKKKKCDEERPQCARCVERGSACVYEPVRPRQRRRRTDSFVSTTSTAPMAAPGPVDRSRHQHRGSVSAQTPTQPEAASPRFPGSTKGGGIHGLAGGKRGDDWVETVNARPLQHVFDDDDDDDDSGPGDIYDPVVFSPLENNFDIGSLVSRGRQQHQNNHHYQHQHHRYHHHHHSLPAYPHVLPPAGTGGGIATPIYDGNEDEDGDEDDHLELRDGGVGSDVTLVDRRTSFAASSAASAAVVVPHTSRSPSFSPDLAMIAPCPVRSPLLEFSLPVFSEFSDRPNRRALVDHFCNVLSHLIVFREEAGNPFQQLVLPLSQKGSPVTNAVYALASAHLEHRGVENAERSLFFHNQAIQGLAKMIQVDGGRVNRNEILAAIILLVYYEVLVQQGRSNIVEGHLKGALTVMCSNSEPLDSTGIFLERAFRFYDVIAALSFGTAPLSTAPAAGCLLPFPPVGAPAASSLKNVDTLLGMATTLWPVIHRLSGLLSLRSDLEKAQVAGGQATKVAVLRTEFETTASAVENALCSWKPSLPPQYALDPSDPTKLRTVAVLPPPGTSPFRSSDMLNAITATAENSAEDAEEKGGDSPASNASSCSSSSNSASSGSSGSSQAGPGKGEGNGNTTDGGAKNEAAVTDETTARLHSILNNALAYRHSAFVYLYRTIQSRPRSDTLVQTHARLALRHCAATVTHAGPMSALLWPLFVAACEATSATDRALAGDLFAAVERRQGMTNIGRAWEIVREVWRRADLLDGDDVHGATAGQIDLEGSRGRRHGEECVVTAERLADYSPLRRPQHFPRRKRTVDLWRMVSDDLGVNIVFG